jgi:hypothetical protein
VSSKESFMAFLRALANDARAHANSGDREWVHGDSLIEFLDAIVRWAPGRSALTRDPMVPEEASWRCFAQILHAGKVYE